MLHQGRGSMTRVSLLLTTVLLSVLAPGGPKGFGRAEPC